MDDDLFIHLFVIKKKNLLISHPPTTNEGTNN